MIKFKVREKQTIKFLYDKSELVMIYKNSIITYNEMGNITSSSIYDLNGNVQRLCKYEYVGDYLRIVNIFDSENKLVEFAKYDGQEESFEQVVYNYDNIISRIVVNRINDCIHKIEESKYDEKGKEFSSTVTYVRKMNAHCLSLQYVNELDKFTKELLVFENDTFKRSIKKIYRNKTLVRKSFQSADSQSGYDIYYRNTDETIDFYDHEAIYDNIGNITYLVIKNLYNSKYNVHEYKYIDGKLSEELVLLYDSGELIDKYSYAYNIHGDKIQWKAYYPNQFGEFHCNLYYSMKYEYDHYFRKTRGFWFDETENGKRDSIETYKHNKNGQMVEKISKERGIINSFRTFNNRTTFTYDSKNRILEKIEYYKGGKIIDKYIYQENSESYEHIRNIYEKEVIKTIIKWKYLKENILASHSKKEIKTKNEMKSQPNNKIQNTEKIIHDKKGRIRKKVKYLSFSNKVVEKYEYHNYNNELNKIIRFTYHKFFKDHKDIRYFSTVRDSHSYLCKEEKFNMRNKSSKYYTSVYNKFNSKIYEEYDSNIEINYFSIDNLHLGYDKRNYDKITDKEIYLYEFFK
mgnify:FL=1